MLSLPWLFTLAQKPINWPGGRWEEGLQFGQGRVEEPAETSFVTYLAGRIDTLFSDDAVALIHDASRGLPRQVNNLATQSLIAAYAQNKSICDESSARAAVTEVSGG